MRGRSATPVDKQGHTVDFLLSKRRDVVAAKRFFFPGDETAWSPEGDHLGWLRRLASGGHQPESGRNVTAPCAGAILQVFEQRHRTRSSPDKAANQIKTYT